MKKIDNYKLYVKGKLNNMLTDREKEKLEKLINEHNEIRKCRDYYSKIQNRDYSCINEALKYTNQKYAELCFTDADLIIAKGVSQSIPINNNIIQRALENLECINDLLIAKVIKEIIKK